MSEPVFQCTLATRSTDFDEHCSIKMSALMDLFQDAAWLHAEALGVGFFSMLERGYLWVLVREKIALYASPAQFQKVNIVTWPVAGKRIDYSREFRILDEAGTCLAEASSQWVLIDKDKRKLALLPNVYGDLPLSAERIFTLKKLPNAALGEKICTLTAGLSQLDPNGHINNKFYADFVREAMPERKEPIRRLQIDFQKEIMAGDTVTLFIRREDGIITGMRNDEAVFCAAVE